MKKVHDNKKGKDVSVKLSDYPDGNLPQHASAENQDSDTIGDDRPEGRTIDEATDPSKLSDI